MALVDLETAALFGRDPCPLESLIKDIYDPVPSTAKMALERWEIACEASRDVLYVKVAELVKCCADKSTRLLAMEFLQHFLVGEFDYSGWKLLSFESQNDIKSILLLTVAHAVDVDVRGVLFALISHIADYRPFDGSNPVWPELIGFMYQCLSSVSERLIVISLLVIDCSPVYVRDTLLPDRVHQGNNLQFLHQKLSHFLASDKHAIKLVSLRASIKFILCLGKEGRDMFQDLASPIIQALNVFSLRSTSHSSEEATCHNLLGLLHGLEPHFFTSNCTLWLQVANCLLSFAETMSLKPQTRYKALSLFVRLAAVGFPSHHVVSSVCITKLLNILFRMMADITRSDGAWFANSSDIDTYDIEGVDCNYAHFLFGEITNIIGGQCVLYYVYMDMISNAQSGDWKLQHTRMIAISNLAPRLHPQDEKMEENVNKLLELALKTVIDPHPRVRWAAACAIKSLRDHQAQYVARYKDRVTSLLQHLMDSEIHARVKARLEAAQASFGL